MILNRAKSYYHENIEVLREKARNKYRGLSEEEKEIEKENMEEIDIIESLKKLDKKAKKIHLGCIILKQTKLYTDYMNTLNNTYIKSKICSYNDASETIKNLILSICYVKKKTFLDNFFEKR